MIRSDPISPSTLPLGRQLVGLAAWIAICFLVAFLGAAASINAPTFYAELTQPEWAPPAWLFGPVWTTLFSMMAVAAWLVWRRGGWALQRRSLGLFLLQLVFNALWSWLFFAWQLGGLALADIVVLWVAIAATIATFRQVSRVAAVLLVPYLAWVTFAGVLNFSLWRMNP